MRDAETLVHANGHRMAVVIEPLAEAVERHLPRKRIDVMRDPPSCGGLGASPEAGRSCKVPPELRLVWRNPVPQQGSTLPAAAGPLCCFEYNRLALAWRARRLGLVGRARRAPFRRFGLVRVDDGMRKIYVPHVRRADRFQTGISRRLEAVAEKYLGATGYAPREGDVVVDVGAGIGEFTLWCADAGAQRHRVRARSARLRLPGEEHGVAPERRRSFPTRSGRSGPTFACTARSTPRRAR